MRVITGRFKGRRLTTVGDLSVRPATDRVKQVIFDILATRIDLNESSVLDLFAGTGSLGIEALSRGAAQVDFVEKDEAAARCIEQNLMSLQALDSTIVYRVDALRFVEDCTNTYDLVFADPPYGFERTEEIPARAFHRNLIREDGYLVMEHSTAITFQPNERYALGPVRKFGRTVVTLFSHLHTNRP